MKISLNLAVATLVIIAMTDVKTSGSVVRTPAGAIQNKILKRRSLESLESKHMDSEHLAKKRRQADKKKKGKTTVIHDILFPVLMPGR